MRRRPGSRQLPSAVSLSPLTSYFSLVDHEHDAGATYSMFHELRFQT